MRELAIEKRVYKKYREVHPETGGTGTPVIQAFYGPTSLIIDRSWWSPAMRECALSLP